MKKLNKVQLFSDSNKVNKVMQEKRFIYFVDSFINFIGTMEAAH